MAWKIEFNPGVEKELDRLGRAAQHAVVHYLNRLAEVKDPRARGKALRGKLAGLWRYRVDKYRILCKIEDARLIIVVVRVGKRDVVYD